MVNIGSGNGLPPGGCQAISWTSVDFGPLEQTCMKFDTNIFIKENAFENVFKMSAILFSVLTRCGLVMPYHQITRS